MMRWSDVLVKNKATKSYVKATPTAIDGHNFPSKLHASVYQQLKLLEAAGEIRDIRCEVTIPICGKLKWKVDFVVFNIKRGVDEAHEAKGYADKRFLAICQAWDGAGPMDANIWKGSYRAPFIAKTIKGKK